MTHSDVTDSFPSPTHPLRFSQPGREGASQALPPDEEGQITQVSGGGEMQSWGDFALQKELHRHGDDDPLA
ncbi:hypothetical protein GTO89_15595 [Heliobacterium gestii]|uniref:Uncharacterized protein n=1 Tax=Heliomicrobium gestii TaxID=2699 RepID=A0A845LNJ9_HELGE|nr:hypothetical protein [Heliomicrobium gestii]MBM7868262.1 hypothetical protein [Heliomicrobium gestii]MZP44456.1 hypothetical protein [Heliomicrobium gestii]